MTFEEWKKLLSTYGLKDSKLDLEDISIFDIMADWEIDREKLEKEILALKMKLRN